jgi:VWFA-related protein
MDAADLLCQRRCYKQLALRANAVVVYLVFLLAVSVARAQQEPKSGTPGYTIETTVRRVIVDVVVTNAEGEPAAGLVQKDFSVSEDGIPQQVLSFDAHQNDGWKQVFSSPLPANTFVDLPREPETGPLYLLLYDLLNCDTATQMFARRQLLKFINERPAGTRFAIVALSDGPHLIQGFTADKQLLAAALDISGKTPHMPMVFLNGANYGTDDRSSYLSLLHDIVDYLDGLPGHKNVLWVSSQFPFALFASQRPDLVEATRKELTVLAANQISIYPVDASGIEGVNSKTVALDEVAWETGGHVFYNTNDVAGALDKAVAEGATYYTLSYSSTNHNYDGKLRHIQVKLAKEGYQLSYRRQYYADPDEPAQTQSAGLTQKHTSSVKAPQPIDHLDTLIRHGMPMSHEILFSVHPEEVGMPKLASSEQMATLSTEAGYFRTRKKKHAAEVLPPVPLQSYSIAYAVPVRQFGPVPKSGDEAGARETHTLEFAAAAYDVDGRLLNGSEVDAAAAPRGKAKYYQVVQPFDVPTDAKWICVAVRDTETGRIGNLEFALPLQPAK